MSQLTDVEEQLHGQAVAVDAAKAQLQQEKAAAARSSTAATSMKQLHTQQCQELQMQIDMVRNYAPVPLVNQRHR